MNTVTSKDGTKIAYDKVGTGPALLLVDGAFCFRESGTTPMLKDGLSQHFTLYTYDRRGRGESDDTEPYSVDREIEDLAAMMQIAGGSPYVLAFSSGAALALQAVAKGLKPKKLALFEAPYVVVNGANQAEWNKIADDIKQQVAEGRRSDAVKTFMTKIFGMPGFMVGIMKLVMKDAWKKNESVAHTLPYDIEIMDGYEVPKKAAASVTMPTVVMGGEKSPAKLHQAVEVTAAAIPGAKLVWLPKQSHMIKPAVMTPAVVEFFNS